MNRFVIYTLIIKLNKITLGVLTLVLFPYTFFLRQKKYERILVYRGGALGDFLFGVPAILELRKRYPNAHITLLTALALTPGSRKHLLTYNAKDPEFLDFVRDTHVDEIIVINTFDFQNLNSIRKKILKLKHNALFILSNPGDMVLPTLKKLLFLKLLGAGSATVYGWYCDSNYSIFRKFHKIWGITNHRIAGPISIVNQDKSKKEVELKKIDFNLNISRSSLKWADDFFERLNGNKLLLISPGSIRKHKQWPCEKYYDLIDRLQINFKNITIGIIGTSYDHEIGNNVRLNNKVINLATKISLSETAAVLKLATLLITNDGGSAHLASAVCCPVITIGNGINHVGEVDPWFSKKMVIRNITQCSPCFSEESCPMFLNKCVIDISVEEVFNAASKILLD